MPSYTNHDLTPTKEALPDKKKDQESFNKAMNPPNDPKKDWDRSTSFNDNQNYPIRHEGEF